MKDTNSSFKNAALIRRQFTKVFGAVVSMLVLGFHIGVHSMVLCLPAISIWFSTIVFMTGIVQDMLEQTG